MSFVIRCLLLMLPLLALPQSLLALDISGKSRTYILDRETADDKRVMPLYEYLDLRVANSDTGSISFNVGGWLRRDLMTESFPSRSNEDLQYAYLSLRTRQSNGMLSVGRILVNEGAASEQIDGLYARTDLKGGITLAAFGGSPLETKLITQRDARRGDSILGGRVSQGIQERYTIGISYLDEKDGNVGFRREEAVDIWIRPVNKVDLMGMSVYDSLGKGWSQHTYYTTIGPFGRLRATGEFSRVNYKQFFASSTLSAFTFTNINPDETLTSGGGSLEIAIVPELLAIADYKNLEYNIAGHARFFGGRLAYAKDSFSAGAGIHRMDSANDSLVYDEQAAYISKKISKTDISLSYLRLAYKEAINGVKDASSATAAAGYSLTPRARIVADMEYARTPEFTRDVRIMATLVYQFDFKYEQKAAPKPMPSPTLTPPPAKKPAPVTKAK